MLTFDRCGIEPDGVDSEWLDCLEDNLAVLLRHAGASDLRFVFGSEWHFDFDPAAGAMPTCRRDRIEARIERTAGFRMRWHEVTPSEIVARSIESLDRRTPVLLMGDAFLMPWLPYYGKAHMDHSFIVEGVSADREVVRIVDAYANRSEWGVATPVATYIATGALAGLAGSASDESRRMATLERCGTTRLPSTFREVIATNARGIEDTIGSRLRLHAFSQYYRQKASELAHAEDFALAVWLVARARGLYALWLRDLVEANATDGALLEAFTDIVVGNWKRATELSYVMLRRVRGAKRAPESVFDLIDDVIEPAELRVAGLAKAFGASPNLVEAPRPCA